MLNIFCEFRWQAAPIVASTAIGTITQERGKVPMPGEGACASLKQPQDGSPATAADDEEEHYYAYSVGQGGQIPSSL